MLRDNRLVDFSPKSNVDCCMQAATLSLSNRNSVSNALKIFKCNRSQSVFGFRNMLLGNAMVNILGESSRPAGKLLQVALGRFGSFGLKPGFQRIKSLWSG